MTGSTPLAGVGSLPRESRPSAAPIPHTPPPLAPLPILGGDRGRTPAGVALSLRTSDDQFEITVLDREGASLLTLGPFPEEEVVATWRGLGRSSGLPLLLQRADGQVDAPYPQIGRLELGAIRIRRRHGLLNHRRPRFLTRRKVAPWPARPAVHREREIFAGEAFPGR